jgi:hypothetical protein
MKNHLACLDSEVAIASYSPDKSTKWMAPEIVLQKPCDINVMGPFPPACLRYPATAGAGIGVGPSRGYQGVQFRW